MDQPADKAKPGQMKRIGELFVESQLLSESEVQKGLEYGKKTGMPLGRVLVMLRLASDADLRAVLHVQQLMKFEGLPANLAVRALDYMRKNKVHIEWAVKKIGWESEKFRKDLPPALREIKEAIASSEERLGAEHPEVAKMMLQLVDFYTDEKMFAHAEATAEQALAKLQKTYGETDLAVAEAALKFSDVLFIQERWEEAQPLALRAYETRAKLLGETHSQTGVALRCLGEVFEMQRRYADAERCYTQALLIAEQTHTLQDIEVLYLLRQIGFVCRRPGRTPDTVLVGALLTDAGMVEPEKVPEALAFGKENNVPLVRALVMMDLLSETALRPVLHAQLLIKSNLIPAVLAVRILRICHQRSVPLDEGMAIAGWQLQSSRKDELSNLLLTHDELVEAERTMHADDPQIGALCLRLADLFESYERYADAEPLYKRALAIMEKSDGELEALAEIMDRLAYVFVKQQKFDLADAIYQKVLEIRTHIYGDDSEQMAISYANIGRLQCARGDHSDGVIWFEKALPLSEKHFGESHPQVGDVVEQLALSLFQMGDHARAEPLFWRAYKIRSKYLDVTSVEIVTLLTKLADMYNKDGNYNLADSVLALFHESKSVTI